MLQFTIAIPNYNSGPTLERAIRSVLEQDYPNVQMILADGESTDESAAIIAYYERHFDPLIRRRDAGQADALNTAFRHARGDIHAWLCADDELLPGALAHVAAFFESDPGIDLLAGACDRVFEGHFCNYVPVERNAWEILPARNGFDQPSVFWRSSLHARIGELDTSYELAFDFEFWCRMRSAGARLATTKRVLSRYYFSGENKSSAGGRLHVDEGYRILERYGPYGGRLARLYRFLYYEFDLKGCMDEPPSGSVSRGAAYRLVRIALGCSVGTKWLRAYNWHFASLQERKLDWWDYKRPQLESRSGTAMLLGNSSLAANHPPQSGSLDHWNLVLNQHRLQEFTREFAADCDVRDALLLDSVLAILGHRSAGLPALPERLWEYVWSFKALDLRRGGMRFLDAGPSLHLAALAALAGNAVFTAGPVDPILASLGVRQAAKDGPLFDCISCCGVTRGRTAEQQRAAAQEFADSLNSGGRIALTLEYGEPIPGGSIDQPSRHHPAGSPAQIKDRYIPAGVALCGNKNIEEPQTLYDRQRARHTLAFLLLSKEEAAVEPPRPAAAPSLMSAFQMPGFLEAAHRVASERALRSQREEAEKQHWAPAVEALERVQRDAERLRVELRKAYAVDRFWMFLRMECRILFVWLATRLGWRR